MYKQALKSHAHCVFRLYYHIVFVTKHRRKVLSDDMLGALKRHFDRLCQNSGSELVEFNGEPDHVHLLVDANPNITPSRLINTLKTISSRELRKEFKDEIDRFYTKPVLWSRAYCILSAGGAPLDVIKRYIENQGIDG
jgi:putative transposase